MTRHARGGLVLTWIFAELLGAGSAAAERPKCPPGERPGIRGCVTAAPRARPSPSPAKDARKAAAVVGKPAINRELDPRTLDRTADKRLLLAELQRLEALLQVTKKGSPDRPVLLRRLAEGYVELERLATLERETAKLHAERADLEQAEKPRVRATF